MSSAAILWALGSIGSALLCCAGYYLPYWIQGRLLDRVDALFSSFRRCNYPRNGANGGVEIVEECGRYAHFADIPSPWWQACTVLVGAGAALSLLVAVTAATACCVTSVIHARNVRIAGMLQLLAALLIIVGASLYPLGWNNQQVRESCGLASNAYNLNDCQLSWSVWLLFAGVVLLFACFAISFYASRVKVGSYRI